MNKEVIYLETEDDITDILTKLQQAEQKLVALVPPKKGTILRSAINMKLVARVAKECEKVVVIVTADPAIVKMAMTARIPVAKNLQSRPVIPTAEHVAASTATMDVIEEDLIESPKKSPRDSGKPEEITQIKETTITEMPLEGPESASDGRSEKSAHVVYDFDEESLEETSEGAKKAKKSAKKGQKSEKSKNPSLNNLQKWLIIGIPAALVLILVLVWAFVFAPAATVTVAVSSTASNFAENISFTTDSASENLEDGVFFAEKVTFEQKYATEVEANGEVDRGTKATGQIKVTFISNKIGSSPQGFTMGIDAGDIFTTSAGQKYRAINTDIFSWDGDLRNGLPKCDNSVINSNSTCTKTFTVDVEAVEAGTEYNISGSTIWNAFVSTYGTANVSGYGSISGGTTNMVKVVDEKDVNEKVDAILAEHTIEGREMLFEDLGDDVVPITGSFAAEASKIDATPAIGDEVGENTTPKLEITAAYSVYVVSRSEVEEYIRSKTNLANDYRIYAVSDPYFDRFTALDSTAKLKAVVKTGPVISEDSIWEKIQGQKTGRVQSLLRSINGINSVEVRTSYFWVSSIPNNRDKVTINLTVDGQEGGSIDMGSDDEPSDTEPATEDLEEGAE